MKLPYNIKMCNAGHYFNIKEGFLMLRDYTKGKEYKDEFWCKEHFNMTHTPIRRFKKK